MYVPATCPFTGNGKGNSPTGGSTHEHRNRPHHRSPVTPFIQNLQQQQQKAQTSNEAIAANVKALIEQLEEGHSEGLTAYSWLWAGSQLQLWQHLGDRTAEAESNPCRRMYAWNQLGRRVNKSRRERRAA